MTAKFLEWFNHLVPPPIVWNSVFLTRWSWCNPTPSEEWGADRAARKAGTTT